MTDRPTLTLAQSFALEVLAMEYPTNSWHFNRCGCCVCFHPDKDTTRGWVIGPDGAGEYHERMREAQA